ncbi:hypothetical protein HY045_02615 [Candidatus Woesebacteria bacterium]|nr:hypothetical protein [Candidatus Woesebacteria bacterium]
MKRLISWGEIKNNFKLNNWIFKHLSGLFVFNLSLLMMVLLNTAGYFKPFYYIGINTIFFLTMILGILLLDLRTKSMFTISLFFLVFAAFLKIVKVDVWADRASIYFFEALIFGLILMVFELFLGGRKTKESEKK